MAIIQESEYSKLIRKLQLELSQIRISIEKKRKKDNSKDPVFSKTQQAIYDFITSGKNSILIDIKREDGTTVKLQFDKGDAKKGLMHILLRHYGEKEDGTSKDSPITAKELLNITTTVRFGRELSKTEIKKKSKDLIGYSYERDKHKKKPADEKEFFRLLLLPQDNGNLLITFFCPNKQEEKKYQEELKKEKN